jgi:cystathionine beta-lyase
MDFEGLEKLVSDPTVRVLVLCNPHNPVGRAWSLDELRQVANICSQHDVMVISDEIHCDIMLHGLNFVPFADAANGISVRWAALHGPIKTFGVAGLCDTLMITDDDEIAKEFERRCNAMSLNRNNVFGLAAFHAGYNSGSEWLDGFIDQIESNFDYVRNNLPNGIELIEPEATYLAWLDFSGLGMDVPKLTNWLAAEANIAVSPGHWFGREGAGFARMTIAVEREVLEEAMRRLKEAVSRLP